MSGGASGWHVQTGEPRVLLIEESPQGFSLLARRTEKAGCKCRFATSCQQARSLLALQDFDLVLSPVRLCGDSLFWLIELLAGSDSSLFYYQAVEEGCCWLPAVRFGQKCFGSGALRPGEFASLLDETIVQLRALVAVSAGCRAAVPQASVITLQSSNPKSPRCQTIAESSRAGRRRNAG